MNLDRLATTIEHDRRAAHEERDRAAAAPPSPTDPRNEQSITRPGTPAR